MQHPKVYYNCDMEEDLNSQPKVVERFCPGGYSACDISPFREKREAHVFNVSFHYIAQNRSGLHETLSPKEKFNYIENCDTCPRFSNL